MTNEKPPLCACGCGERVTKLGNKWIKGHDKRSKNYDKNQTRQLCECGCGELAEPGMRFIYQHHCIGKKPSQEILIKRGEAISKAKMGVSRSDAAKSAISKGKTGVPMSDTTKSTISRYALKEKPPLPNGFEIDKSSKRVINKNCSQYLGCYIAEQILSKIFKDVKVMPQQNHGYDIICNQDKKIDIKSSATGYKDNWHFNIWRNKIADYFLCIAFDNREDLNPVHLWLIPGEDINHLTGIEILKSKLSKWSKYEQPIDKVITCCNEMKGEEYEYEYE